MADNPKYLDLELWLDQDIILRQNNLKANFWEILAKVGNTVDTEALIKIHASSRGVKLSKGSELLGYPYQVLDLIRDFDPSNGLNIRLLNWFGHGFYLFVLAGKNHPKAPLTQLQANNWRFDQSSTPWDYPEIILNQSSTNMPTVDLLQTSTFYQWHKSIKISKEIEDVEIKILNELDELIRILT